jgi:hypothetical protein
MDESEAYPDDRVGARRGRCQWICSCIYGKAHAASWPSGQDGALTIFLEFTVLFSNDDLFFVPHDRPVIPQT